MIIRFLRRLTYFSYVGLLWRPSWVKLISCCSSVSFKTTSSTFAFWCWVINMIQISRLLRPPSHQGELIPSWGKSHFSPSAQGKFAESVQSSVCPSKGTAGGGGGGGGDGQLISAIGTKKGVKMSLEDGGLIRCSDTRKPADGTLKTTPWPPVRTSRRSVQLR